MPCWMYAFPDINYAKIILTAAPLSWVVVFFAFQYDSAAAATTAADVAASGLSQHMQ
jgi:hypothetical protein